MESDCVKCLQCGEVRCSPCDRIIQDSCGHYKCRPCLLTDTKGCSTCAATVTATTSAPVEVSENKKIVCLSNQVVDIRNMKHFNLPNIPLKTTNVTLKDNLKIKKFKRKKRIPPLPEHFKISVDVLDADKAQKYECTKCGSKFKERKQIYYHKFCGMENPFSCTQCPKKFLKKSHYKLHMNVHAGIKSFTCDVCKASFYEKSKLITHSRIHNGTKSHKCDKCDSAFYTASALREHEMTHSKSKPHSCKNCNAKLSNRSNLKKHEAIHLNMKFFCPTCNKKCNTKYRLKQHSKMCTKSFACRVCSKPFQLKKDTERHMLTHSRNKKYQCNICQVTFRRKDNVFRHARNTHSNVINKNHDNSSIVTELEVNVEVESRELVLVGDKQLSVLDNRVVFDDRLAVVDQQGAVIKADPPIKEKRLYMDNISTNIPILVNDINDETYSRENLYKKIFLYKDHERFIPSYNQPLPWKMVVNPVNQNNIRRLNASSYGERSPEHPNAFIELSNDSSIFYNNMKMITDSSHNEKLSVSKLEDTVIELSSDSSIAESASHYYHTARKKQMKHDMSRMLCYSPIDLDGDPVKPSLNAPNNCTTIAKLFDVDSEEFSKQDIIKANESRQSVIFNIGNVNKCINHNKSIKFNKSHEVSDKNTSNCKISNMEDDVVIVEPSSVQTMQSTVCNSFAESAKSYNYQTSSDNQDGWSKPVYLHKKVNYNKKSPHNQHNYIEQAKKNKPLSKEQLSELYKKILIPSYKGTESGNQPSCPTDVENVKKLGAFTNDSVPPLRYFSEDNHSLQNMSTLNNGEQHVVTPVRPVQATVSPHWRRRLAHSSEID